MPSYNGLYAAGAGATSVWARVSSVLDGLKSSLRYTSSVRNSVFFTPDGDGLRDVKPPACTQITTGTPGSDR